MGCNISDNYISDLLVLSVAHVSGGKKRQNRSGTNAPSSTRLKESVEKFASREHHRAQGHCTVMSNGDEIEIDNRNNELVFIQRAATQCLYIRHHIYIYIKINVLF